MDWVCIKKKVLLVEYLEVNGVPTRILFLSFAHNPVHSFLHLIPNIPNKNALKRLKRELEKGQPISHLTLLDYSQRFQNCSMNNIYYYYIWDYTLIMARATPHGLCYRRRYKVVYFNPDLFSYHHEWEC